MPQEGFWHGIVRAHKNPKGIHPDLSLSFLFPSKSSFEFVGYNFPISSFASLIISFAHLSTINDNKLTFIFSFSNNELALLLSNKALLSSTNSLGNSTS